MLVTKTEDQIVRLLLASVLKIRQLGLRSIHSSLNDTLAKLLEYCGDSYENLLAQSRLSIKSGDPVTASTFLLEISNVHDESTHKITSYTLAQLSALGEWLSHDKLLLKISSDSDTKFKVRCYFDFLKRLNMELASTTLEALKPSLRTNQYDTLRLCYEITLSNHEEVSKILNKIGFSTILGNEIIDEYISIYYQNLNCSERKKIGANLLSNSNLERMNEHSLAHFLQAFLIEEDHDFALKIVRFIRRYTLNYERQIESLHLLRLLCFYLQMVGSNAEVNRILENQSKLTEIEKKTIRLKDRLIKKGPIGIVKALTRAESCEKRLDNRRKVCFPLLIYGQRYVDDLNNYLLKSLLSSKDFSILCREYNIEFWITTLRCHVLQLNDLFHRLPFPNIKLKLTTDLFDEVGEAKYLRAIFFHRALAKAELERSIIISLCPDALIGNGISSLVEKCPEGGGAGGMLIRASDSHIRYDYANGRIDEILHSPNRNDLLASYALDNWKHHFQSIYTSNLSPIFKSKQERSHYEIEGFLGVPFVLKPSPGLTFDFISKSKIRYNNCFLEHTVQFIDHELPSYLQSKALLYSVRSVDEFCFIELSASSGYSNLKKTLQDIHKFTQKPKFILPNYTARQPTTKHV